MAVQPRDLIQSGAGSFRSVVDMWNHRVGSTPQATAMTHRVGTRWRKVTWREADRRVRDVAHGLLGLGLGPEDRAAILAPTSVSWVVTDFGILAAGGATTTIHPSERREVIEHILRDAEVVVAFCGDDATVDTVLSLADRVPSLRAVVVFDGHARDERVRTLADLESEGRTWEEHNPGVLDEVQAAIGSERIATLIYTSGTTGQPKGVELTHDAWVYEAEAIDSLRVVGPDDLQFLFLPLAHVFAKVMQVAFVRLGVPTAVDGSLDRFIDNVAEIRPTWMAGVPRVFEKAHNRIADRWRDRGPVAWQAFTWAVDVGRGVAKLKREGRLVPPHLLVQHAIADRILFRPVRDAFGGRLRFVVSGGAPLSMEVAAFFDACGIPVCEGYGLTESSAASCVNRPDDIVLGTVGRPLPGCEVKVARDGEILLRSRGVMRGYHGLPDETAAALDEDGWLHTGDTGSVMASGHVRIEGRKKDLIVTAGGKNVAPAHAQQLLEDASPLVAHAMLHGDERNFCSALLSLDADAVAQLAERRGLEGDAHTLADHPDVKQALRDAVADANRHLASYEQVRAWTVVPTPFSVADGTLTPTLKVKRHVIEERYAALLDGFYAGTVTRY